MAEFALAEQRSRRARLVPLRVRYRLTPWWVKVIAIFVASRVVSTLILLSFSTRQPANQWTGANPGYFDFAGLWDGRWYNIIAVGGYPSELPMTADGHVGENAWAFMPAYPALVRLFMALSGQNYAVVSVVVSVAFAVGAALMFYRLMQLVLPGSTALFAVVLFCVAPLSPMLQVSYAESMQLFLLASALYLLMRRRYGILIPVVAVMSLTRPTGLAFALAMVVHVAFRWWMSRPGSRSPQPFPVRERVLSGGVVVFSAVMGLAWLLVAWAVTGSVTAYTDTELAWRAPYIGYGSLAPFTPWIDATGFWAQWLRLPQALLVVPLTLVVAALFLMLFTPVAKKLGMDMRFWMASYLLYILAVFFPQSSTFRLLMPLFPALGAVAIPQSKVYRVVVVVVCVLGQWLWVDICWWVDGYDWTPP